MLNLSYGSNGSPIVEVDHIRKAVPEDVRKHPTFLGAGNNKPFAFVLGNFTGTKVALPSR